MTISVINKWACLCSAGDEAGHEEDDDILLSWPSRLFLHALVSWHPRYKWSYKLLPSVAV